MHRDHDIFVKAIREKRKIKLTLPSKEPGARPDKLYGPILYSPTVAGADSGCYYVWDFESGGESHFLGLLPTQIVSMELTDEGFDPVEFFTSGREVGSLEREGRRNLSKTETKSEERTS
ncbi:MAG: hypothetical protein ACYSUC_01160 [Planctomycetota bacterium]|jgi:hypothetical protein